MWIPTSEAELKAAIESESVEETATLDFKRELGSKGKNKEIAKDIAAMCTEGGVLVYGVDEDEASGRPLHLMPIALKGAPERIANIVATGIQEPPAIDSSTFQSEADPNLGYLVVAVPASPRAPHMVILGGDNRYYGRLDRRRRILSESDIARLYARRQRWERDAELLLDQVIEEAPFSPQEGLGFLHMMAEPVIPDDGMLGKALGEVGVAQRKSLSALRSVTGTIQGWQGTSHPSFDVSNFYREQDGWCASTHPRRNPRRPEETVECRLLNHGGLRLFAGRVGDVPDSRFFIYENNVADWAVEFLHFAGHFYRRAHYVGAVDIGLALTGLEGGVSFYRREGYSPVPAVNLTKPFRMTLRCIASELVGNPSP